jgi:hypothetical protein
MSGKTTYICSIGLLVRLETPFESVPWMSLCSSALSLTSQTVQALVGTLDFLSFRVLAFSRLTLVSPLSGSFVPAEYASFPLFDSLLSRLSNEDDMGG